MLGSAGLQVHEGAQLRVQRLCVAMALKMAASVEPTYITRLDKPGAMPSACVMSRVCSVSSQARVHAARAGSVGREQRDGNVVGLLGVREVGGQIGQIGAVILQQAQRLAAPVSVPP